MAATKATAKQKAYYTKQRESAEKTGDKKTLAKIYSKLDANNSDPKTKYTNRDSSYTPAGVNAQYDQTGSKKKSKLGGHRGS
jgi:hypothetical protein